MKERTQNGPARTEKSERVDPEKGRKVQVYHVVENMGREVGRVRVYKQPKLRCDEIEGWIKVYRGLRSVVIAMQKKERKLKGG